MSQVTLKINQIPSWKTDLNHPFTTKVEGDMISLLGSMYGEMKNLRERMAKFQSRGNIGHLGNKNILKTMSM